MVKKEGALLFLGLFIVLMAGNVFAADVAYIYKKDFRIDDNIVKLFQDSGLTVDLIKEASMPRTFDNYRFIFVGDEKFTDASKIPVNRYPSIIVNYNHATDWGLTDEEGVSLLAQNSPLSVRKDGRLIQVYTQGLTSGMIAIPYYFLDIPPTLPLKSYREADIVVMRAGFEPEGFAGFKECAQFGGTPSSQDGLLWSDSDRDWLLLRLWDLKNLGPTIRIYCRADM